MTEEHQVSVIGYWEVAKRRNIDIGPLGACTLTQLLRIVTMLERLRREFGFKSRGAAEEICNSLPALRNTVRHPIRPLVGKPDDIRQLLKSMGKLEYLTKAIRQRAVQ